MRFDLESTGPTVANVDDSRILSRPLQHVATARRQPFQMHARRLVRTMFAPHDTENAEFSESGFATAQKPLDFLVFVGSEAVLPNDLWRKCRRRGGGHGEALLSHFACRDGSPICRRKKKTSG